MKKVYSFLLCLVMVAFVAIPMTVQQAQAATPAAQLKVAYAPTGDTSDSRTYGLYFIARIETKADGSKQYVLNEKYAGIISASSDIDLTKYDPDNAAIHSTYNNNSGKYANGVYQVGTEKPVDPSVYDDAQKLLVAFGNYINANSGSIKPDYTAPVVDGYATFNVDELGLYLGSLPASETYQNGSTTYYSMPFILSVPYITRDSSGNDLSNTVVTVQPKISEYTPSGGGGGRDRPPNPPPVDPPPVNPPDTPPTPTPPPVDIPDEPVPLVDIPDNPTPQVDVPDTPQNPNVKIPDQPVPLAGRLPQTGLLWWPVPVMAILGAVLVVFGWRGRVKSEYPR